MSKIITKEQLVSEIISNPEVFSAVSSVVQYWDVNNADKRLDLLGAEYKNEIGVRKSMDYRIPGFEFEKIWDGLLFQKINIYSNEKMDILVHVPWSQEGYDGIASYTMMMMRQNSRWKIIGIHF
jgi:hypothetical protein